MLQDEERGEQKDHEKVGNGMAVEVPHPNPCYPEGYEVGQRAHDDAAPLYVDPKRKRKPLQFADQKEDGCRDVAEQLAQGSGDKEEPNASRWKSQTGVF